MGVAEDFRALVDDESSTYDDVHEFLGKLSPDQRREAIRAVGGKRRQGRLYELAAAGPELALADLIPEEAKDALEPVIFHGKNSLPTFTHFQKRFCWAPSGKTLIGYNHQTWAFVTGPGYFVARATAADEDGLGPIAIDYNLVPDEKPADWPPIKDNERGLGRMVYGHMIDYLRALADGVFIGRAVREGKVTDNYFLLAREPLE